LKAKQLNHFIDRMARELDRWENEGGALLTGHRHFIAGLTIETEKVLKELDAAGGRRKGHAKDEGRAIKFLVKRQFVKCSASEGGFVTYDITNAGRELVRGLQR